MPTHAPLERHTTTTRDGRSLEYYAAGSGPQLAVLEAGLGVGAHYWEPVMHALAPHCRVLAYNRAGIGGSDPDPKPRTLERLATDLRCILDAQTYKQAVLVGHSWGGPIIRTASAHNIPNVTALVLVDPSDENLLDDYHATLLGAQRILMPLLARVGLAGALMRPVLKGLPPQTLQAALTETTTLNAATESAAELRCFLAELHALAKKPTPDLPMYMISGQSTMKGESTRIRAKIRRAHKLSATQLPAQFVNAPHSGHAVPISEPDLVAHTVLSAFASPATGASHPIPTT